MQGILFHTLKGIKGWSDLCISTVDVNKINKIYYEKRLFCIFNKDHRYNLTIEYLEPRVSNYFVLYAIVYNVQLIANITKRYKTEIEVKNEIEEIKTKQQKIEL